MNSPGSIAGLCTFSASQRPGRVRHRLFGSDARKPSSHVRCSVRRSSNLESWSNPQCGSACEGILGSIAHPNVAPSYPPRTRDRVCIRQPARSEIISRRNQPPRVRKPRTRGAPMHDILVHSKARSVACARSTTSRCLTKFSAEVKPPPRAPNDAEY